MLAALASLAALDRGLLIGAILLGIGVATTGLAERRSVPALVLFLAIGMALGDDGFGLIRFERADIAQTIGIVALVVILFEGGLSTSRSAARAVIAPAFFLATVGTAITAFTVGGVFFAVFGLSWNTSLLIAAVVASTDAAAVFAVLGSSGLPQRLLMTLEVESGFNDPMAVLLTVGLLEAAHGGFSAGGWLLLGVRQLAGGAVVGLLVGRAGAAALRRPGLAELSRSPVLAMAIGGFAYGLAAVLGGSGFLAVYVAGLLIGRDVRFRRAVEVFHKGLASTAQIGLFLMLGLLVFPSDLPAVAGKALLIAAALVFVARPLAVAICLAPFGFTRRERIVASWAGLRGGVPIVLATFPLTELHPDGHLIFNIVFFVVLLSATVQGLTITGLARRLGVTEPGPVAVAETIGPLGATLAIEPQP